MTYGGSQAQAGRGSTLSIGATPTLIGEVKDVPLNRGKWDVVDTTNFESGSDSEQLVTMRKPGSCTFKGNRVSSDTGQAAVETAYQSGALVAFVLTLPKTAAQTTTGDKYTFNAFVVSSDFSDSTTAAIEFTIELNISGGCTLTVGS
jgi:hypothetical protein